MSNLSGEELRVLVEAHRLQLGGQWHIGDLLGVGKSGCVFRWNSTKVIKFTSSEHEAEFAITLISEKASGFPRIYWVDKLRLGNEVVFSIIKEDIDNLHLESFEVSLIDEMCEIARMNEGVEVIADCLTLLIEQSNIRPSLRSVMEEFSDFLVWCAENYIHIQDINRHNVGVRPGSDTLVIRDFGCCFRF